MVRLMLVAVVSLILAACASGTASQPPEEASPSAAAPSGGASLAAPGSGDPAAIGRAFIDALARGDLVAAEAMEGDTMRKAAPAASLAQLWGQLTGQFGDFGSIGEVTTAEQAPYTNATVQVAFANATLPMVVTVDADGLVAGLHLGEPGPASSAAPSGSSSAVPSPAAYVRPDAFTETEVTVGTAPWVLPGTLSMPTGDGPFPAVVLLAGSGQNDRDETIGPNAPLRDLAWGLASSGIAVLRYDKRTKAYGTEMAAAGPSITVKEETIDDALAAIDQLRQTPGVDPGRVFVAGHSLGGHLAPRIAAQAEDKVAGIALLEANTSSLPSLILDQITYLASPDGGADPQAAAMLDGLADKVALAESPDLSPTTPATDLPLGIPAPYLLDLRTYDPAATAKELAIPIFISQGGRDYQVPPTELAAWRTALAGRDDVAIHEYPALNHLLMSGSGPSRPAEYAVPGHVAPELVADLAAWIQDPQGG